MLMHDAALQLFGLTPTAHADWVFRFCRDRASAATTLFQSLQTTIANGLGQCSPSGAIGNADRPSSLLQAKLMLIAERLASGCRALVLDEPTWGLSDQLAFPFLRAIAHAAHERDVRLIVISHHEDLPSGLFHSVLELSVETNEGTRKLISIDASEQSR